MLTSVSQLQVIMLILELKVEEMPSWRRSNCLASSSSFISCWGSSTCSVAWEDCFSQNNATPSTDVLRRFCKNTQGTQQTNQQITVNSRGGANLRAIAPPTKHSMHTSSPADTGAAHPHRQGRTNTDTCMLSSSQEIPQPATPPLPPPAHPSK